ncbi:copper chaperone PCu(A)C [Candidatus Albibeggiatoa sp. nov. NOAA]|uniref:copper chaperone PCu(A)C n=1 Tax=Candidatus Albibeggiatoa sp. nov. NOAA TaxID=3162724 RepID=UPI0032FC7CE3|nr:copper chaperone PCu(A)C [Thiotrichaceae bacterium]
MRNFFKTLLLAASLLSMQALHAEPAISVDGAWVRAVPPNSKVTAAYMNIHNASDQAIDLISGATEAFKTVELHQTVFEGEMAKMVKQEKITVPAQGTTALKPGDYHIMLIGRQVDLKAGDTVELTLQFSDETSQTLEIEVKQADMPAMKHHHH